MEITLQTKTLDHLGLISGMYDELGLGTGIDELVQTETTRRDVSIGTLCKALVLNGLGFTQRTLYMVSSFFEGKPVELLLGEEFTASQLNDSVWPRPRRSTCLWLYQAVFSTNTLGFPHFSRQLVKQL